MVCWTCIIISVRTIPDHFRHLLDMKYKYSDLIESKTIYLFLIFWLFVVGAVHKGKNCESCVCKLVRLYLLYFVTWYDLSTIERESGSKKRRGDALDVPVMVGA